jgi:prevent-host-death family protein
MRLCEYQAMSTMRVKSNEARENFRDLLDHVERGGRVEILRYNRPVAVMTPYVQEEQVMTVTLYETNSDLLVLARGDDAWEMGAPDRDYLNGSFASDAKAWLDGDWEPHENDGQSPSNWDLDDLTAVAECDAEGVRLLVDVHRLGGAAEMYLGADAV